MKSNYVRIWISCKGSQNLYGIFHGHFSTSVYSYVWYLIWKRIYREIDILSTLQRHVIPHMKKNLMRIYSHSYGHVTKHILSSELDVVGFKNRKSQQQHQINEKWWQLWEVDLYHAVVHTEQNCEKTRQTEA